MATIAKPEPAQSTGRPTAAPAAPSSPEPPPAPAAAPSRRGLAFALMGAALVALAVVGVRHWIFGRSHVSTDDAQVDGHIIPVLPKAGGFVTRVSVDENQRVKVGDTLVILDDRDYLVRLAQTEADLSAALASVSSNRRVAAETAVRATDAALAESQAALAGADARVAAARAARDQAALNLSYTRVTAPASGIVSKKTVELGQLVQQGQPLMSVVPLDDIWVTANLKETQSADVRPGDSADITVDAYPGRHFAGHVESLSPATGAKFSLLPPDNATGNYTKVVQRLPVRVRLDGSNDALQPLRPGMSVVVTIQTR
jgi:membrane fusion protein (multidrug efflux system)